MAIMDAVDVLIHPSRQEAFPSAELAVHGRARFAHQFAAGPWARRLREAYVAAIGQRAS